MREVGRGRHIDLTSPRGYYLDYSRWADAAGPTDAAGLPVRLAGAAERSPRHVARYALGNLELYLEGGSESRRNRFASAARWITDNMEFVPGSFGSWAMPDPPAAFRGDLEPGWFSGSAHAECVSVLVRASLLLSLSGAIEAAAEAFPAFRTPVAEGGLLREVGEAGHEGAVDSLAIVEEFPMADRASMVLLGHVRALWAIFDYARASRDDAARRLFDRCTSGLEFLLHRYDLGFWTRLDLDARWRGPRLSSPAGIAEQALSLRIVHQMTQRTAFSDAGARWSRYAESAGPRLRASVQRLAFRLANPGAPAH